MKRVTLIALLFLLSGAKAQSAPIAGAAIQDWYYDAANNVVNLRIVNPDRQSHYRVCAQNTVAGDKAERKIYDVFLVADCDRK